MNLRFRGVWGSVFLVFLAAAVAVVFLAAAAVVVFLAMFVLLVVCFL